MPEHEPEIAARLDSVVEMLAAQSSGERSRGERTKPVASDRWFPPGR